MREREKERERERERAFRTIDAGASPDSFPVVLFLRNCAIALQTRGLGSCVLVLLARGFVYVWVAPGMRKQTRTGRRAVEPVRPLWCGVVWCGVVWCGDLMW